MEDIIKKHKYFWSQRALRLSFFLGLFFLFISLVANYYANIYTTIRASNSVSDIILDNIPVFDVDFFFIEGFIMFLFFIVYLQIREPGNTPFIIKSIALFIIIRSIFISLTHIALPPNHLQFDAYKFILDLTSGNDLFFSSHTGLPFLMALIYWDNKVLRYSFLAMTVFFASVVLLAHLHYSIDVFGALFITYSIFTIAKKLFSQDHKIFKAYAITPK